MMSDTLTEKLDVIFEITKLEPGELASFREKINIKAKELNIDVVFFGKQSKFNKYPRVHVLANKRGTTAIDKYKLKPKKETLGGKEYYVLRGKGNFRKLLKMNKKYIDGLWDKVSDWWKGAWAK